LGDTALGPPIPVPEEVTEVHSGGIEAGIDGQDRC
jgi:hypothetical protein